MIFFFLREAFGGLECAENAFSAWALPRTLLGSSRRSADPLVGWGGETPPRPHPTRRLDRSGLPPVGL